MVEGSTLVAEAVAAGWRVEAQYVAAGGAAVVAPGVPVFELAPGVIERVASTESPQPVLAVVDTERPDVAAAHLPSVLAGAELVLVADRIGDPGNLGTMLRSAEAAGVDLVVLTPSTADPFNPKVVRASAGALFHVPVVEADLGDLRAAGIRVIGTSSHRGLAHTAADWTGRVAIVVGNEAHGLDDDAPVDEWVTIEHAGRTESLNVAMAATVLCFEAARQRS